MDEKHFNQQMDRLKSQWKNSYGDERTARLWLRYEKISDSDFTELVNLAIDKCRGAPLAEDFATLEIEMKNRQAQEKVYTGFSRGGGGFYGQMQDMAKNNKKADGEFVQACLKLLRDRLSGKITEPQFLEGCACLDQLAEQLNPSGKRRPYSGGGSYSVHTAPRD